MVYSLTPFARLWCSLHGDDTLKSALITGITGQDGSYLAEFLVSKGYRVYGMVRRSSSANLSRVHHLHDRIELVFGDLLDQNSLVGLIESVGPDEVYNLAAQSFIPTSWSQPVLTGDFTGLGVARMLEAIRTVDPGVRFYQASTSEMFGKVNAPPQNESTPLNPCTPYGAAKAYGHFLTVNYRETYGMYACSGILFNHESPRRALEFVTRKITHAVARIKHGLQDKLKLGSMDARRDWGFAGDYVRAMWAMLQQEEPEEFVVATGESHSVAEFVERAFSHAGLAWEDHVEIDDQLIRRTELELLVGDASKAREKLGWEPAVDFEGLVDLMVDADLEVVEAETSGAGSPHSS